MPIDTPAQSKGVQLDSPPPRPPGSQQRSMMDMQRESPPMTGGMGPLASSPQLMTMQGLAMAKQGFQLLSNGLPALAQLLTTTIMELEQIIPQAMADQVSGIQPPLGPPQQGAAGPGGPQSGAGPQPPPGPGGGGPPPMSGEMQ